MAGSWDVGRVANAQQFLDIIGMMSRCDLLRYFGCGSNPAKEATCE